MNESKDAVRSYVTISMHAVVALSVVTVYRTSVLVVDV